MIQFKRISFALMVVLLLASCATKNISYFQDLTADKTMQLAASKEVMLQPGDKVSIVVKSKDPQLAALVNLPIITYRTGDATDASMNQSQQVSSYTLDGEGNIEFPMLGKICLKGLNRTAAASLVKERLINANIVKDPTVTVEFMNLQFSVLGEVNKAGRYSFNKDKMTILDAISMAGDLTIYGERENVRVLRTDGDIQKSYIVNLTSDSATVASPAYYMQQNDVVYVSPNKKRVRDSTVNGNNVLSTSFWISIASLAASITSIIVR